MQAPLSSEQINEVEKTPSRLASIRTKVGIVVAVVIIITVAATTWISYTMFNGSMVDEQTDYAFGVTDLAVQAVDPARVDDYLRLGEQAEGFAEAELARIRDTFPAVRYIYAYRILEDGCHVVLDPDLPDEPGSDPGDVIPFDNAFIVYRDTLLAGVPLNEGVISNESYGWLLTVYKPVYDDQGVCQCYVAAVISMDTSSWMATSSSCTLLRCSARSSSLFVPLFCGLPSTASCCRSTRWPTPITFWNTRTTSRVTRPWTWCARIAYENGDVAHL